MRLIYFFPPTLLMALLAGCGTSSSEIVTDPPRGIAGYYSNQGSLDVERAGELMAVYKAAQTSLTILGYSVETEEINALTANIRAGNPRAGESAPAEIKLIKLDGDRTSISIRIGVFGDEEASREILTQIDLELLPDPVNEASDVHRR